ncbi:MAG: hypothetical protein KA387_04600 [Rubrivivax sp.]|nr:hypothetical protein [Rubrivivax sp.]
MRSLEPRITALEASHGNMREPLLILRRIVSPGSLDACPMGTLPAPPHLPAVDCLPGESWEDFGERLAGMVAHLPPGTVVQVTSRDADTSSASG